MGETALLTSIASFRQMQKDNEWNTKLENMKNTTNYPFVDTRIEQMNDTPYIPFIFNTFNIANEYLNVAQAAESLKDFVERVYKLSYRERELTVLPIEDKDRLLETGMNLIRRSFTLDAPYFLNENEMWEWFYEDNRLAYLINQGKEPVKIHSNQDYHQTTEALMSLFEKASRLYLQYGGETITQAKCYPLMIKYYDQMLKNFDNFQPIILKSLYSELTKKIINGLLTSQDIKDYHANRICLFTFKMNEVLDRKSAYATRKTFEFYINHWDSIRLLLTNESKANTVRHLTNLIDTLLTQAITKKDLDVIPIFVQRAMSLIDTIEEEQKKNFSN